MGSNQFFNTHHSPVGAWSSLTFGAPDIGMSIDVQDPVVKKSGMMMAGWADANEIHSIGFLDIPNPTMWTSNPTALRPPTVKKPSV